MPISGGIAASNDDNVITRVATIIPVVLNVTACYSQFSWFSLRTQVENDLQLSDIADVTDRQVLTDANDPAMFIDKRITTVTIHRFPY